MASSSEDDRKYDVFLSSGGEDIRRTFTDHLYCSLKYHRVDVFMYRDEYDCKLEERNGAIPEHLIQAIERSKVAVVVFSRGYPESLWCLEELVKIMECRKTLGQMFFPIFYDVDPSDVRKQRGSFKQAFKKYGQKINDDKVHVWRKALREAGDLAGLNFRQTDGHEGTFIRNVISQITGKQSITTSLEVPTSLVGIDSRVREISKHLDVGGSNDICTIGILGMCGLGKTTVAKAIFNKHHHNFDGASFLQKVREKKLVDLQEQLLSDILKPAYKGVSCIDEGTKEIEQRLGNRRVLVVIDDLDSVEQIDALAIKPDSFGPGSRIIITSRNKHLLKIVNVDKICPLPAMSEREALELLSWHAFGKNYPNKEYVELSRKAVGYCGGLPLALEVLGFYLRTKSTIEWETVLDKWNRSQPYKEIHRTLETSYDGLTDDDVKAIFLDISCFFTGMNKDYVMTVLDGCQFYPEIGIRELQDQCLVTVDKEGNLMMHDLIQSMGREIVLAESPDNPGRRSRLWHNEDITDVLMKESGTEDIEGLALDMQESDALSLSSESFRNMQSLRLLKLNNIKLTGGYHNLSKELRWLCWHGFPLEVMPKDFDQPNLAAIDLSYSKLIRVWEDSDLLLEKLKLLNLSHSHNLAQTPDFSKLPNLEELILNDCENLSEVHSSIGNLERLTLVNLEGCKKLRDLPLNFFNSKSIETLLLNGCSRFENLAEGLGKSYHKTADGTPIRQILKLSFPSQYGVESPSTSLLPPSLHGLNSLRKLDLGRCTLTDDEIPKDLGSLISLEDLDLQKNSFCSLPSLSSLSQLETLCLDDCTNLHAIPNLPTNLKVLRAGLCTALETLPDFSGLSNMRELYLSHSGKLTEIPGLDMSLNSMTRIHLEGCINLTADFRKNILQGWTSCGYGGIFLNGNYIPDWFDFVEGDLVSFHIPLIVGRNFSGLTLCFIYSSKKHHEGPLSIIVCNKTKSTALLARITYASIPTSCTLDDHYLWQGHISNYVLSLQGGDKIDIFVKPVETADASVRVKKIGVNLVWDKFMKENMHYSDLHLYDFDQHPDWLLGADGSACLASTSLSMAERGSYAQGPRLDFQQLLVEAQHRWLRPAEICEILTNFQKFCIAPEPPNKPPSGSLYLFDRNVLRYFRRDGHNWRKKRDRRTVKEGYEKLKVGGVEVLHCYYAHGEDDENFQRRCYWMLQQDLMHIVFVHYLQVKGNWLNAGGIRENDEVTSDLKKGSPWTSSPSNSNVQDDLQSQLTNAESECLTISSSEHDVPKYGNVNYAFTLRQQLLDREKGLKKVDSFSNSNVQDDLQSQLTNAESECLTISSSEHDFPKYGNVNYAFTLRQQLLDREEGLKKVDSFSRSVFKEFEEVDDLQVQSSSGIPWSMDECGDVVDGSSLSLSISQDQLFSMVDFSPKWAYTDSEIEVLVFGTFLVSQKEVTKYSWSCMFGEVEVPAQVLASGVLFCFAPPHSAGQVPFYVTCSNRLACSEVREFDYQVGSTKGLDMTDIGHGAAHEMHLHLRLESLLSLRPLSPLGQLFGGVKENQNLISKIISLKEEEDYLHAAEPTVVNYLLQNEGMEHLLKLMKEKLYTWLLYKAIEDGKGPSVLDAEGQGVLHLAAALGYDWAIKPTVTAGVSINFRDVNGWTALHWAAFCSREHTVAVLVSLGADPGALTDPSPEVPLGRTPADLASVSGHKGISGFLAESSLTTYLKSLAMNNAKEDGAAEISGTKVVKTFSERIATPLSYGDMPDALSLNDSLTSITNATQVADRIQQMFRMQSFKRRRLTEYDSDEFGMPDERAISLITSKSHKGPINGNAHTVAVQIQKKFRGWKKRKEFLIIRQRIVKIQAHVRGHQVRKQYKAITWSVGILEKAILRWRRKGTGLRGFRPDAVAKIPDPQPVASSEDDYDFLKKRKKTGEFSGYCFSERFDHGSES